MTSERFTVADLLDAKKQIDAARPTRKFTYYIHPKFLEGESELAKILRAMKYNGDVSVASVIEEDDQ